MIRNILNTLRNLWEKGKNLILYYILFILTIILVVVIVKNRIELRTWVVSISICSFIFILYKWNEGIFNLAMFWKKE